MTPVHIEVDTPKHNCLNVLLLPACGRWQNIFHSKTASLEYYLKTQKAKKKIKIIKISNKVIEKKTLTGKVTMSVFSAKIKQSQL